MTDLTLYIGKGCPYCEKVTSFLKEENLRDKVEIKEVWNNKENHEELMEVCGDTQVPCLSIDDEPMHESLEIIEKLKQLLK